MHGPEPTAEELAYGRRVARIHGVRHDPQQFAAGYALGRRQAESEAFAAGRKEAAAAIRAHIIAGARPPEWARAGAIPNATAIREWAARIAEGIDPAETPEHADGETPEQSVFTRLRKVLADGGVCRSEYERAGGRNRGDRIVRCHLPDGHPGEHEEADTEIQWSSQEGTNA
jgi:hypothetical protein